ncbi:single-stranded DNA-binding protein [Megasphaera stantonii]|uniref:single-stranded DNA-binding protein n=1 Tax=Megasphaera stantonii TaxID=2144175 RepID=UPI00320A8368
MNTSFYGRLTRDPEIRTPQNGGNPYTTITVATQVRNKDRDGKNKSIFIDAVAFGKSGEILAQYFHKGSRIVVHGEINDIGAWIGNRDGQAHASVSINITGFDFVDTKAENERPNQPPANTSYAAPAQPYGSAPAGQPYTAPPTPPAPPATGYTMPPGQPNAAPPAPPYAQPNPYEAPF